MRNQLKSIKATSNLENKENYCDNFGMNISINQSSWINIRNATKTLRKRRNISYESTVHNIYNPEFSSSSEKSQTSEFSSLEISFELNDSYEELKIIDWSKLQENKNEKSIKFKKLHEDSVDRQRSLEPLFSISPK